MYVSSWPGLDPRYLVAARTSTLPFPLGARDALYFYRARNALYHLFRALIRAGETVLVPDYHSGNEAYAIRAAGADVRYYRIRRDLGPDLGDVERGCRDGARAVLAIHFMGFPQPIEEIARLTRRHGAVLVEDCALAMLSETAGRPLGSLGDFSVFCLYKTLPVPNGAVLAQNRTPVRALDQLALVPAGAVSVAGRSAELTVEWIRGRAERLGALLARAKAAAGGALTNAGVCRVPVGDMGFELSAVDFAISAISRRILSRLDYASIVGRRRQNYRQLAARLDGVVDLLVDRLDPGVCPLFFPILVPDKRDAASELARSGIDAVQFWNEGDPAAAGPGHHAAQYLRHHVLELPVHQDVGPAQVDHIVREVTRLARAWRPVAVPVQVAVAR